MLNTILILIAAIFSFAAFLTNIINSLRAMPKKPGAKKKVKVTKKDKPKKKFTAEQKKARVERAKARRHAKKAEAKAKIETDSAIRQTA